MENKNFIPVASPVLAGNETEYVLDCLKTTWISSNGKYIEKFENKFSEFCQVDNAITCSNGTVALHLALLGLGIGQGDEVIIPTLTYIATANAVSYCGAKPIFVDSDFNTWNINPELIEEKISEKTKAIIVVHLYGNPVNMDPIMKIAKKYGLFVIEDAAEAHGGKYKGKMVGSIGDVATFSFYGNKIITTGEGGIVTTNNNHLADKIRQLKGQGVDPNKRYWFPIIGYNYRLTNIAAAIGLAQLEKIDWHLERRYEISNWYQENLKGLDKIYLQVEQKWAKHVYWMFSIVLDDNISIKRDDLMSKLTLQGIETRPIFYPMHVLPPYKSNCNINEFPNAEKIAQNGINLPTWAGLLKKDIRYISNCITESLEC